MVRLLIFYNELLYNTVSQYVINNSVSCLDRTYIKINLLNKEENND
jgi:hypothetical protein